MCWLTNTNWVALLVFENKVPPTARDENHLDSQGGDHLDSQGGDHLDSQSEDYQVQTLLQSFLAFGYCILQRFVAFDQLFRHRIGTFVKLGF